MTVRGRLGPWVALVAVALAAVWATTIDGSPIVAIASVALGWLLIFLSIIDIRSHRLPDAATLPLLLGGLAIGGVIRPVLFWDHLAGAAAGFLLIWSIAALYRWWRGVEGVGMGDAKLLAAGGAWVAWQGLPTILAYAALGGLLWILLRAAARRGVHPDEPLPFGPFLAMGIWLTWLYGPLVWS